MLALSDFSLVLQKKISQYHGYIRVVSKPTLTVAVAQK